MNFEFNFNIDNRGSERNEMNVRYGAPVLNKDYSWYYEMPGNKPDDDNKDKIYLPIDGTIKLVDELKSDFIDTVDYEKTTCVLKSVSSEIAFVFGDRDKEKIFTLLPGERELNYSFKKLEENWNTEFFSFLLNKQESWNLEFKFVVILSNGVTAEPVVFTIKSDPTGHYSDSTTNVLFVPPVKFYAETNKVTVENYPIDPLAKSGASVANINCGEPKGGLKPGYTYSTNTPSEKNEIKLMAPLSFTLAIENTKYPHGTFLGMTGVPSITMDIPNYEQRSLVRPVTELVKEKNTVLDRIPPIEFKLPSVDLKATPVLRKAPLGGASKLSKKGNVDYEHDAEEIKDFFKVMAEGKILQFTMDPDWGKIISAATLNAASKCNIYFSFDINVAVQEKGFPAETVPITIDSDTITIDPVKYNAQEYVPVPVPVPVPTIKLNAPLASSGNVVKINIGEPADPKTWDYSFASIGPNPDNTINIACPLDFILELDGAKYPKSVFKNPSVEPTLNIGIPGPIGTKNYKGSLLGFFSNTGKTLKFTLVPNWNVPVDADALNNAGLCTLDFNFEIEMETDDNGTKKTNKVFINQQKMPVNQVQFNAQVIPPIENGIRYMELKNRMGAVIKFDLWVKGSRVGGDRGDILNPSQKTYDLSSSMFSVVKSGNEVSPFVDVVAGKDNSSTTRCKYDPKSTKTGRYRITGTTGKNTLHYDGIN